MQAAKVQYKRAADLFPAPVTVSATRAAQSFEMKDRDRDDLVAELEATKYTGCIKVVSVENRSRSAALLYQGRVVGCLYGSETDERFLGGDMKASIALMMEDLCLSDTAVEIYSLPKEIVLPMAALFITPTVREFPELRAGDDYQSLVAAYAEQKSTVCLAVLGNNFPACVVYIYNGKVFGVFDSEAQVFSRDLSDFLQRLEKAPSVTIDPSVLPADCLKRGTKNMKFGHSLNSAADE